MDVGPTHGTIIFGATDYVGFNPTVRTGFVRPHVDNTYDLGTSSFRYRTVYANQVIVSGAISGTTIGGQEWEYPGSMVIDANSASDTIVNVVNQGAGRADLQVDRNIFVGGLIDGVDLSVHVLDANAHHDSVTGIAGIHVDNPTQVISIQLASISGLNTTSGLAINDSLAGDGLDITSKILRVGAGAGITVNTNDVQLAESVAGFGLIYTSGILEVNSSLIVGAYSIEAGGGLTVTGGGNLSLDPILTVGALAGSGISVLDDSIAVDSSVIRNTYVLTSGNGLIGGGSLGTGLTLSVGTGNGITVNADNIEIDLAASSGLYFDDGLALDDGIAGNGLSISGKVISVGPGTGMVIGADNIAVDTLYAFTWGASHIFAADVQIAADLDFIGVRKITSDGVNALTIMPGGDLVLDPNGDNVLPGGSVNVDLGDYNRKWKSLYVGELVSDVLVAQSVMATIGGRISVGPTTTLTADFPIGATIIHVKHNIFDDGDFVIFESISDGVPSQEVIEIDSGASGSAGDYTYTVIRNRDETGGIGILGQNNWLTADSMLNLGHLAGEGYIDLTSTQTIFGHSGPTITVYARPASTVAWDDLVPVVTMGNLDSYVGYGTEYGFAVGNDLTLTETTGFSGVTVDRTLGVRLFNTELKFYSGANLVMQLDKSSGLQFRRGSVGSNIGRISWFDSIGAGGTNLFSIGVTPGPDALHLDMAGVGTMISLDSSKGLVHFPAGKIEIEAMSISELRLSNPLGIAFNWSILTGVTPSIPAGAGDGDLVFYNRTVPKIYMILDKYGNLGIGNTVPSGKLDVSGDTVIWPSVAGTNNGYQLLLQNRTAGYLTSGTYSMGKIAARALIAWNSNFSATNVVNAGEIDFRYTGYGDGRVVGQEIGFNVQQNYSGPLVRAATLTATEFTVNQALFIGGHASAERWYRQYFTHGYYASSNVVHLVRFYVGAYTSVQVHVSYSQFMTGYTPDRNFLGSWRCHHNG